MSTVGIASHAALPTIVQSKIGIQVNIFNMHNRLNAYTSIACILNKLTTVFYVSVLLLIMNFVITLSKWIQEAIAKYEY